jgi:hypothetical protein
MSNNDDAGPTKSKLPTSKNKKKTASTTAKLKLSKWYQGSFRSIGITKERLLESRDDVFK